MNEKTAAKPVEVLELDSTHSLFLWQIINAQGVAVPPKEAASMAQLYANLRVVAIAHGHEPPDAPPADEPA